MLFVWIYFLLQFTPCWALGEATAENVTVAVDKSSDIDVGFNDAQNVTEESVIAVTSNSSISSSNSTEKSLSLIKNMEKLTTLDPVTEAPVTNETNPYEQGPLSVAAWTIVYFVMVIVALVGNVGICFIIFTSKRMKTVTNFFLANTAVADCNVVLFNTVFNFTYGINNNWYFGVEFCHFINFIPIAAVCCSILSITVISLDRFVIIMYPFRQRISPLKAKLIIGLIWIVSLAAAFPQSYYARVDQDIGSDRYYCYIAWPNSTMNIRLGYQVMFMSISYAIPLTILAVSYIIMGIRLYGTNADIVGEANEGTLRRIKANKKAVHMMMLVVISFAICWLPYHMYFILGILHPEISRWQPIQQVYLSIFWLAMSSTMYNPFIYCWVNARFRQAFWGLLSKRFKFARKFAGSERRSNRHSLYYSAATNQTVVTRTHTRRRPQRSENMDHSDILSSDSLSPQASNRSPFLRPKPELNGKVSSTDHRRTPHYRETLLSVEEQHNNHV